MEQMDQKDKDAHRMSGLLTEQRSVDEDTKILHERNEELAEQKEQAEEEVHRLSLVASELEDARQLVPTSLSHPAYALRIAVHPHSAPLCICSHSPLTDHRAGKTSIEPKGRGRALDQAERSTGGSELASKYETG